ncbi:MAG: VTT domain-containing protein [Rhodomicrobium sp.]|jgi:uncharacterized membrane protein YdjX (TVP38/TMEM64 family)
MALEFLPVEFAMPRFLRDRRLWLGAAMLGVIAAIDASGLAGSLTLETLRANRLEIVSFVADHRALSALCFVGVYVVVVALSLPSAVLLTLSGGFLFGAAIGSLLTVIGATLGATLLFIFARTMIGECGLAHFGTRGAKLARAIQANAWTYLLVLRLLPLFPFFLVNVIPALAGVRLGTFVATTFIGIFPATFIFSLSGAGLGEALDRGGAITLGSILTPEIMAALGGLALLTLASIPLRRKFGREAPPACRRVEP